MNIIIIANGLFPTGMWVDTVLRQADRVVCCDGALEKYLNWQKRQSTRVHPSVDVVGDGDSLNPKVMSEEGCMGIEIRRHWVEEQEYNDLTKATRFALEQAEWSVPRDILHHSPEEDVTITYIGATGLREDHTLGNISLLAWYMEQYPGVGFRMISDYGMFVPMQGHGVFDTYSGQQVSLFSLTPEVPVTVKGLRWPIESRQLTWWWEASLNEAMGDSFEVWGGRMVVYLVSMV